MNYKNNEEISIKIRFTGVMEYPLRVDDLKQLLATGKNFDDITDTIRNDFEETVSIDEIEEYEFLTSRESEISDLDILKLEANKAIGFKQLILNDLLMGVKTTEKQQELKQRIEMLDKEKFADIKRNWRIKKKEKPFSKAFRNSHNVQYG